jgi:hypothetical protein
MTESILIPKSLPDKELANEVSKSTSWPEKELGTETS